MNRLSPDEIKAWLKENVARDVQAILNDRPEYMPLHTSSDENGALLVWIAQKFINADPAELLYCDGSGDGQIDIFHSQQADGSIAFTVYQVHAPDLAHISEGKQKEVKGKLLDDVRGLYNNLFEQKVRRRKYNDTAKQAYQMLSEAIEEVAGGAPTRVDIRVVPITLNRINEQSRADYDRLRLTAKSEWCKPTLTLTLDDPLSPDILYRKYFDDRSDALPEKVKWQHVGPLAAKNETSGPHLCFVKGMDVIDSYETWKAALLDANLRYSLGKHTAVNEKIAIELETGRGIKWFHQKNNGLVVACKSVRPRGDQLELVGPQILNGGQTLVTLFNVFGDLSAIPPVQRTEKDTERIDAFRNDLLLAVKIVQTSDDRARDDIALASNTQNPISPRTLRSSTLEMTRLKHSIASMKSAWFLETKDGEWDAVRTVRALVQARTGRTAQDFKFGEGRRADIRKLDNKDLGVALLAFYGFVEEAKPSRVFADPYFRRIFGRAPEDSAWAELSATRPSWTDTHVDELFGGERPGPHLSLLAWIVYKYWSHFTYSESIQLLLAYEERAAHDAAFRQYQKHDRSWDVPEELTLSIKSDDESCYWVERVAKSMYLVLCYQMMRVLNRRYGKLTDSTAAAILAMPEWERLRTGYPVSTMEDFRGKAVSVGPLTALGLIMHTSCRHVWAAHSEDIKRILSPQQALLQDKWVRRLSDQVDKVCEQIGRPAYRLSTGLDPRGESASVTSIADILPAIELAEGK